MPKLIIIQQRASVRDADNDDDRLRALGQLFGRLSNECLYPNGPELKCVLQRMLYFCVFWRARILGEKSYFPSLLKRVIDERERQIALRRAQPEKYLFDMASPIPDVRRKLRVVFEECGEVAREVDTLEIARHPMSKRMALQNLCKELDQVSACCAAWLECYCGGAR